MKALETAKQILKPILSVESWRTLGDYVGVGKQKKTHSIDDIDKLAEFISSRASHVAQTTLYGYLRTRAGTRFPELFENPDILISINTAKWHVWAACVSDLSIFVGQLASASRIKKDDINKIVPAALQLIFNQTGEPEEAGKDFQNSIDKAIQRIKNCDWSEEKDDDTIFSQSPEALYYWSPIAEELKERDENIVRNSVRFRWIDIRRNTRQQLDIEKLFAQPIAAE